MNAILEAAGEAPLRSTAVPERSSPLSIAIPVFNNRELLRRCLESLLTTLSDGDEVWLFDDASDEPGIMELMNDFGRRWPATHVVRNEENLGFVGSSNLAFKLITRDIVLLNSDTEVMADWLEHLQACQQRNPRAAIVCPVSDKATILSVLPIEAAGESSGILSASAKATAGDVQLPTAVGFCMLIRRQFIKEAGVFCQAFATGYGEENDLSMRAMNRGWDILAADRAWVLHHSGGSFGRERSQALQTSHQARLDRLWPEYRPLVQSWWRDNPLRAMKEHMARSGDDRDGIIHVLHRQYHVGGTERVTRTLIRALYGHYRHTLLYPGETADPWCDYELRSLDLCRELMLNKRWIRPSTMIAGHGADLACPQSERSLARIVLGSGAKVVHFHHMLHWDSLLLPALVRALGCRVVISVHDLWFNCPVHNQIEYSRGQPCGRSHAQADQRCADCLQGYASKGLGHDGTTQSAAAYTNARHGLIQLVLQKADAVLVPSQFIRDKLLAAYRLSPATHVRVMPHGVAIPGAPARVEPQRERVLGYFGGDQRLKGAELVLKMAQAMAGSPVTFRIFGRIKGFDPSAVPANVELRGFYNPDDVSRAMQGIDLALLPSYYEESFSLVASECWAHGIPVLSSTRGAMGERVVTGTNGWLVSDMQPESWISSLQKVLDGDAIERCRERLAAHRVTSIEQSSRCLHELYGKLLALPLRPARHNPQDRQMEKFHRIRKQMRSRNLPIESPVRGSCLGIVRDHWGTANYRVRFPLEALDRVNACKSSEFHVVRDSGFTVTKALKESGARHLAIQPFLSDEGLRLMELLHRESLFDITLVVDDLWTDLPADNPMRATMPDDVPGRLSYVASLSDTLVLTTSELSHRLGLSHGNMHVINNALPEWIWEPLRTDRDETPGQRLRIGWAGAPQHAGDLKFLGQVMRETVDLADWVFLGMCPETLRPLASKVYPMVPFQRYPASLLGAGLDLAIAPLADHAFNRCKSHLKVLEYGILGLPVIACDLEPYLHCPVMLATADDPEEWIEKIRALLLSPEHRYEEGKKLQQWVLENHMLKNRLVDWQAAIGITVDVE